MDSQSVAGCSPPDSILMDTAIKSIMQAHGDDQAERPRARVRYTREQLQQLRKSPAGAVSKRGKALNLMPRPFFEFQTRRKFNSMTGGQTAPQPSKVSPRNNKFRRSSGPKQAEPATADWCTDGLNDIADQYDLTEMQPARAKAPSPPVVVADMAIKPAAPAPAVNVPSSKLEKIAKCSNVFPSKPDNNAAGSMKSRAPMVKTLREIEARLNCVPTMAAKSKPTDDAHYYTLMGIITEAMQNNFNATAPIAVTQPLPLGNALKWIKAMRNAASANFIHQSSQDLSPYAGAAAAANNYNRVPQSPLYGTVANQRSLLSMLTMQQQFAALRVLQQQQQARFLPSDALPNARYGNSRQANLMREMLKYHVDSVRDRMRGSTNHHFSGRQAGNSQHGRAAGHPGMRNPVKRPLIDVVLSRND